MWIEVICLFLKVKNVTEKSSKKPKKKTPLGVGVLKRILKHSFSIEPEIFISVLILLASIKCLFYLSIMLVNEN